MKTHPTSSNEQIIKPMNLWKSKGLDFPVPGQTWKGKNFLEEDEELKPDVISFKFSGDSSEESGSTSFHGVSHPPEPVDTGTMSHVYLPNITENNGDGNCIVKSLPMRAPFLEDLSI